MTPKPSEHIMDAPTPVPAIDEVEYCEVTTAAVEDLRLAIGRRVREKFVPAGVAPDLIEIYIDELTADVEADIDKFAAGQLEHGGDIRDRDVLLDLAKELLDAPIYLRILRIKNKYIRVPA
jgi:hypothetical protein